MFEEMGKAEILMLIMALAGIMWGIMKLKGDSIRMEGV